MSLRLMARRLSLPALPQCPAMQNVMKLSAVVAAARAAVVVVLVVAVFVVVVVGFPRWSPCQRARPRWPARAVLLPAPPRL